MHSALRLINAVVIVLAVMAGMRSSGVSDTAFETGRWIGAALVCLAPLLGFLGLRRGASPQLRKTATGVTLAFVALLWIGCAGLALSSDRAVAALVGAAFFTLLCGVNLWGLRSLARQEEAGEEDDGGWFAARHWRGEFPLGVAFWVGGIALLMFQLLQMGMFGVLADRLSLRLGSWAILAMFAVSTLLIAWHSVGVWRSAARRAREHGGIWPWLARLSVAGGIAAFALFCLHLLWLPLREHALIATGHDPLPPLEARVTTDDSVLLLHGPFGAGSADRVRRVLGETASIRTVALASPGGRLREAAEIAGLVRERGLDTYVDTRCESACTFVFLAGKDRAATPNARIGFHRPSFAGITPVGFDAATEGMLSTYREAGIPKAFLERVAATEPDRMWYPSARELEDAGVINRVSLGGETSAIGFLAASSKQDLATAFRDVPMMAAMERHFPGTIDEAVQAAWMERTQGGIDSAVGNAARKVIADRYPRILASADDASLDEFADIMVEQMKAARDVSIEACRLLLVGQLNIAQVLSPELVRREQDWALGVLGAASLRERAPVDPTDFQLTMAQATSTLPEEVLEVVSAPQDFADQPQRQCDATIGLYERISMLPPGERHLLLRGMFQAGAL